MKENFYDKFNKKATKAKAINERKEYNKDRNKYFEDKRKKKNNGIEISNEHRFSDFETDAKIESISKLFNVNYLQKSAKNVLDNFDNIVQSIRPLNSRQLLRLPKDINILSHSLTDERDNRRMGYMNAQEELSAYVRYFTWWNLVRLSKVFSNIPIEAFGLKDNDVCLDLGSGPLTVVIALWLSQPDLRNVNLTWYCVDISQSALSLGEDLYMSIAAKLPPSDSKALPHWNIIRVKGECGTYIRRKASLITSANMFNEIRENSEEKPEETANRQIQTLLNYGEKECSFFIAEPGMPISAHFISLMRDRFINNNISIISPCPHETKCPMNGNHARYGGNAKWCNFAFKTEDAPDRLLKLSKDANLPKERAVISFIFSTNKIKANHERDVLRIASDTIRLQNHSSGHYACSEKGLILTIDNPKDRIESGDKIKIVLDKSKTFKDLEIDQKSKAIKIKL